MENTNSGASEPKPAEVQQQQQPTPQQPQANGRPEWLSPKFKTVEEAAKAYNELEKKLGSNKPSGMKIDLASTPTESTEQPAETSTEGEATNADEPAADAAEKVAEAVVARAGLDIAKLRDEHSALGDLSPESYRALEESGITREVVADYFAGQQARATLIHQELAASVGGEDQLNLVIQWGASGLSDVDKANWNDVLKTGKLPLIKSVLAGMRAKYIEAEGNEPTGQIRGSKHAPSGDLYHNRGEMIEDIKNPLYNKSEAYRQKVREKAERSNIF